MMQRLILVLCLFAFSSQLLMGQVSPLEKTGKDGTVYRDRRPSKEKINLLGNFGVTPSPLPADFEQGSDRGNFWILFDSEGEIKEFKADREGLETLAKLPLLVISHGVPQIIRHFKDPKRRYGSRVNDYNGKIDAYSKSRDAERRVTHGIVLTLMQSHKSLLDKFDPNDSSGWQEIHRSMRLVLRRAENQYREQVIAKYHSYQLDLLLSINDLYEKQREWLEKKAESDPFLVYQVLYLC